MRLRLTIILAALAAAAPASLAQSGGPYDLSWSTIDAGGAMQMSGGAFTLSGSIGQFDAGPTINGQFGVEGGYWSVPMATPTMGCNDADLAEPFGMLDFSDVIAFLTAFGAMDAAADLAPPPGVFDFSDVISFLTAFGAGCP